MPWPLSTITVPGCSPASISTFSSPSSVSTVRVTPSAASEKPQVELADEVEPVAHEALVGAYVHAHVEIAGRRAQLAGVPVAGDAHGLAVVDARGDVDAERAPLRAPAAAAAVGAGPLRDLPAPGAACGRGSCA